MICSRCEQGEILEISINELNVNRPGIVGDLKL